METSKKLSKPLYIIGVIIIFLAVYSQYFLDFGLITGFFVVYFIPAVFVSLVFGKKIFYSAFKNNKFAFKVGWGLFGALTIVGIIFSLLVFAVILGFYPNALDLLTQPNPALEVSPGLAWVMIIVSLLVVGPVEEFLFRGFIYGGLLNFSNGKHWFSFAIITSLLFVFVHAYYAITFEVASLILYINIIAFSIAMCLTYYLSEGNLLIPAFIHGLYNATGFLGVATSFDVSLIARFTLIVLGVLFAVMFLPGKIKLKTPFTSKDSEGDLT